MWGGEPQIAERQKSAPYSARGLIILVTRHPELSAIFELCQWSGRRLTVAILVGQRTSSTEPGGLALLAGDASGDLWFRPKLHLICSLYFPMLCHVSHTVSLGYLCTYVMADDKFLKITKLFQTPPPPKPVEFLLFLCVCSKLKP